MMFKLLFLLHLSPVPVEPAALSLNCTECLRLVRHRTAEGYNLVTTLIHQSQPPEKDCHPLASCVITTPDGPHQFYRCLENKNRTVCHSPSAPRYYNVTLSVGLPQYQVPSHRGRIITSSTGIEGDGILYYVNSTRVLVAGAQTTATLTFDVCAAMDKHPWSHKCGSQSWRKSYADNHKYVCPLTLDWRYGSPWPWLPCAADTRTSGWKRVCAYTGGGYPGCTGLGEFRRGPGNTVLLDWSLRGHGTPWKETWGLGIDGTGSDPLSYITICQSLEEKPPTHYQTTVVGFQEVFDEIARAVEVATKFPVSPEARNMFLNLAENITLFLGVTNCFVCGGTDMGEQWPWEAKEVHQHMWDALNTTNITFPQRPHPYEWALRTNIISTLCASRAPSKRYSVPVGDSACTGVIQYNGSQTDDLPIPTPMWTEPTLNATWTHGGNASLKWIAPEGYYYICGRRAYKQLPARWFGTCLLGTVRPSFFLLPLRVGETLGIPLYMEQGPGNRRRRSTRDTKVRIGDWKDNEWPPERIIHYYGPATWAEDGRYGYRTPVYMLNRIIRLQAVLEILTNDSALALNVLARQNTKLITAVYQNHLALDYLLAQEGGVCGKFNLSNCCLRIDDQSRVIKDITDRMVKLAHVPVQTWNSAWDWTSSLTDWLPTSGSLKSIFVMGGLFLLSCLLIPLSLPFVFRCLRSTMETIADRRAAAHIMALQMYSPIPPSDVDEAEVSSPEAIDGPAPL
ncbi:endogenous retrovirus group 3 member 1 Env polyprotein [Microcaecilia unicolor]|uniref:Endogenous retrovirus group 3 member 1 Env polyprotein n=1 Tax=Microcaecilia unicolor TaxID=1415580 RepID=A0A6P7Z2G2_9AMPH|nr:endogenous retrovirus group 3 member 1 Env polyprotein [Microcaecilia unicolor]